MTRHLSRAFLASAITVAGATSAAALPGQLDPSFGQGGIVSIHFSDYVASAQTLIQTDGKIIAVATKTVASQSDHRSAIVIARLLANGAPDTSFGTGGLVTLELPKLSLEAANALLQSDGKLLVCGTAFDFPAKSNYDNPSRLLATRFMPDGTLDTGFGTAGSTLLDVLGETNSLATAILEQSDGTILLAGQSSSGGGTAYDTVLRLSSAGMLDTSFGQQGVFSISPPHSELGSDLPVAAALQNNGKIIVSALQQEERKPGLTFRVNPDGTLDASKAPGQVTASPQAGGIAFTGLAIQPDSQYVIAHTIIVRHQGTGYARPVLERFSLASQRDRTFAATHLDYAGRPGQNANDAAYTALVQPDGKLITAGARTLFHQSGSTSTVLGIARENADGTLDTAFGNQGVAVTKVAGLFPRLNALALQTDGNIVAAGNTNDKVLLVARYLGQ